MLELTSTALLATLDSMLITQVTAVMGWLDYADGHRRVGFIAQLGERTLTGDQGRSDVWRRLYQTSSGPVLYLKLLLQIAPSELELEIYVDPGAQAEMNMLRALGQQDAWYVHCFQGRQLRNSFQSAQPLDGAEWVTTLGRATAAYTSTPTESRDFETARQIVMGLQSRNTAPRQSAATLAVGLPQMFQPQTHFSYN